MSTINNASAGPVTAAGKAVSSQNALTHGLRSKQLLLPSEDASELAALQAQWRSDYQPNDHITETLVDQLVFNQWLMLRADRRHQILEATLPENPLDWTRDQQKLVDNIHRYRTTAERAFNKTFTMLEKFRKDRQREAFTRQRLAHQAKALQIRQHRDLMRAELKLRAEAARTQKAEAKAQKATAAAAKTVEIAA